jgi:ribosome modulation factor
MDRLPEWPDEAFELGYQDFLAGKTRHENPYRDGDVLSQSWIDGWQSAKDEGKENA